MALPTSDQLDQARTAAATAARSQVVALEVENAILRAAHGKSHDPPLVAAALAHRTDLIDDDGNVDTNAVRRAVSSLLHDKPILKVENAPGTPTPQNTSDQEDAAYEAAARRAGLRRPSTASETRDEEDDPADLDAAFERAARAQGLRRGGRS